jgi:hypothetical protein
MLNKECHCASILLLLMDRFDYTGEAARLLFRVSMLQPIRLDQGIYMYTRSQSIIFVYIMLAKRKR